MLWAATKAYQSPALDLGTLSNMAVRQIPLPIISVWCYVLDAPSIAELQFWRQENPSGELRHVLGHVQAELISI
jgi:hypothetical protein